MVMMRRSFASSAMLIVVLSLLVAVVAPRQQQKLFADAHRCIHDDEIIPLQKLHPPQTLPQFYPEGALEHDTHGSPRRREALPEAATPAPIRFVISTLDLYNESHFCTAAGQTKPTMKPDQSLLCTADDVLTAAKRDKLVNLLIPAALKKISEYLSVVPLTMPIIGLTSTSSPPFTIPQAHVAEGVNNTDYVLYVAAGPTPSGNVAWAGSVATDNTGRPIVGRMNCGPSYIKWATPQDIEKFTSTIIHELFHALGFSFDAMQRNFNVPGKSGVLTQTTFTRGGLQVTEVTTPRVLSETRKFFNCDTLVGMELENQGGLGTAGSHWERRNVYEEVMVGVQGDINRVSALTLAAFEDMTYYWPNYSAAESMYYGNHSGCAFITQKCNSSLLSERAKSFFCTQFNVTTPNQCTYNLHSIGKCEIGIYGADLPIYFQYFADPRDGGTSALMDVCPFVDAYSNNKCTEGNVDTGDQVSKIIGHTHGPGGRCVYAPGLSETNLAPSGYIPNRCLVLKCVTQQTPWGRTWRIMIKVRTAPWIDCPLTGASGDVTAPSGYDGTITCPAVADICWKTSKGYGDDIVIEELDPITTTSTTTTVAPTTPTFTDINGSTYTLTETSTTSVEPTSTAADSGGASSTTTPGQQGGGTTTSMPPPTTTTFAGGGPTPAPPTFTAESGFAIRSFFVGTKNPDLCPSVFGAVVSGSTADQNTVKNSLVADLAAELKATGITIVSIEQRSTDGCLVVTASIPDGAAATYDSVLAVRDPSWLTQTANALAAVSSSSITPELLNLGASNLPNVNVTTTSPGGGGAPAEACEGFTCHLCFIKDQPCWVSNIIIGVAVVAIISLITAACKKKNNANKAAEEERQFQREMRSMRHPGDNRPPGGGYGDDPMLTSRFNEMQGYHQASQSNPPAPSIRYDDL